MKFQNVASPVIRAFFIFSLAFYLVVAITAPAQAVTAPSLQIYYQPTTDNQTSAYGANYTMMSFTTDNTTLHTLTSVRLKCYRTGSPGTVTVALYKTSAGMPTGSALGTGTLNGNAFATSATLYEFTFTTELTLEVNTVYAIVVYATSGDGSNYVYWSNKTAGAYSLGNMATSTNFGVTWTNYFNNDAYFEVWGRTAVEIQDVKVFQSYKDTGDWLIAVRYLNITPPYYDTYDIRKYFTLQLVDNVTVKAQNVLPAWGNKVGNIYLAASEVTGLDWGGTYKVRIYGLFGTNPYVEYTLLATDWSGDDLTNLDSWVLSSASTIGTYYNTTMTTYIAEKGEVLNTTGGTIFSSGINGLSTERPDIFQVSRASTQYTPNITTQTYRQAVSDWETNWGADGVIMLDRIGNIIGVDGNFIASIFFVVIAGALALLAFPAGHSTAANILCLPALVVGIFFGVDLIFIGVIGLFGAFLLVKNIWMDK